MAEDQKSKRSGRSTENQIWTLVDYMLSHTKFANNMGKGFTQASKISEEWDRLADNLNRLGPSRNGLQWKRVWRDLRSRTKIKYARIQAAKDNGNSTPDELDGLEEEVLRVIGLHRCLQSDIPEIGVSSEHSSALSSNDDPAVSPTNYAAAITPTTPVVVTLTNDTAAVAPTNDESEMILLHEIECEPGTSNADELESSQMTSIPSIGIKRKKMATDPFAEALEELKKAYTARTAADEMTANALKSLAETYREIEEKKLELASKKIELESERMKLEYEKMKLDSEFKKELLQSLTNFTNSITNILQKID